MALKLEFINVVIPLKLIRERLGQDALDGLIAAAGSTAWHDEYLARFGCMNEIDLDVLLDEWEGRGFVLFEELAGKKRWQDLCVVFSGHGQSYPCRWIKYDSKENLVWLKGQKPGRVVGPATDM